MISDKLQIGKGFYNFFQTVVSKLKRSCIPFKEFVWSTPNKKLLNVNSIFKFSQSNGHIFVDSSSIRRRNSAWKVRGNDIDFERRIHVETMTSTRRGYFDVDSTFKIYKISMSSPRGFFYVVSTSNRRNFCTHCFHSIIF